MTTELTQPMIGEDAPSFALPGIDGNEYSLAGLRGNFVVIHFGTSW